MRASLAVRAPRARSRRSTGRSYRYVWERALEASRLPAMHKERAALARPPENRHGPVEGPDKCRHFEGHKSAQNVLGRPTIKETAMFTFAPRPLLFLSFSSLVSVGLWAGCTAESRPAFADDVGTTHEAVRSASSPAPALFADADDALPPAEHQRLVALRERLRLDFGDVCGDSFCAGRWSSVEPLSFRCSIALADGRLRACVWVFGASEEAVSPRNGDIAVHARTFACKIPVNATPTELLDVLLAPGPEPAARRALPHAEATIADALVECLR